MMLAVTTEDWVEIQEDQELAQEVSDAVDTCIDEGLSYGIFVIGGCEEIGVYGYEKEQFLAMCEAESMTEEELLAQFLAEKIGGDYIAVVYLNMGEQSS
jgi:hypothetical protein